MSLLSKAKEIKVTRRTKRSYSSEEIELVLSLAKGEINTTQVAKVLGINPTTVISYALGALKQFVNKTS